MAKVFDSIPDVLASWIAEQPMFFVASAPLAGDGHVNLSPKGLDTFRVLTPNRVGYLDLTGSGNETSAHLAENGRVTIMLCAFTGPPRILRLFGHGRTVLPTHAEWPSTVGSFPEQTGVRQVIVIDVDRVQTSCGYAVPRMDMVEQRVTLTRWAEHQGVEGLDDYRRRENRSSLDGLPTPLAACWDEEPATP